MKDLHEGVVGMSGGTGYTCALLLSGKLACWGNRNKPSLYPTQALQEISWSHVPGAPAMLSGGGNTDCLLLHGGTAACFGENSWGVASSSPTSSAVPLNVLF